MTEQNERHFARNPELVEGYVLDRLEPALRGQLDAHLHDCAECRRTVELEKRIAAGVRALGREEMKKRLARRVTAPPPARAVPWPRIAAVAALLAVVVGIGYYGNWFGSRDSGAGMPTGEIAEQRTPLSANESSGEVAREAESPPSLAGKSTPAPAAKSRLDAADRTAQTDVAGKDLAVRPTVSQRAAEERITPVVQQQFWATGTITTELAEGAAVARAAEKADNLQMEKKSERDKAEPAAKEQTKSSQSAVARVTQPGTSKPPPSPQTIVLDQRSPSSLPAAQQALQTQSRTRTIQSLIERRADTLRVILYPDSPIDGGELRKARAERIGEDSLLITVEGQQIGFRLPPELRQTRKTK